MYAIIENGVVVDLVSLPVGITALAQLDFLTPEQVAAAVPVPPGLRLAIGWTYSGGVFARPGPPPTPLTVAQQAQAALAAGWAVVSSGTPAISGTYPLDLVSQLKTTGLVSYIQVNAHFPNGATTIRRFDTSGAAHVFPSTAVFLAWATALADYVAALDLIIDSGAGTLPAQPTTIA